MRLIAKAAYTTFAMVALLLSEDDGLSAPAGPVAPVAPVGPAGPVGPAKFGTVIWVVAFLVVVEACSVKVPLRLVGMITIAEKYPVALVVICSVKE